MEQPMPNYAPMYDIDGEMRSSTPDIGPDEFVGLGNINLGDDIVFCPGDSVSLETPVGTVGTPIWSTGDTAASITASMPGTYSLILRNACGLIVDTVDLSNPMVSDLSTPDTLICKGDDIDVDVNLTGATYAWNTGETTQTINIDDEGTYSVVVTDKWGCVTGDSLTVTRSEDAALNISGYRYHSMFRSVPFSRSRCCSSYWCYLHLDRAARRIYSFYKQLVGWMERS